MTLSSQVVSLPLAKRLKELGVKEIEGHAGYYISPDGNVYSTKYKRVEKLVRILDKRGYWRTFLSVGGKPKQFITHRLVAQAFIPNPKNLPQVNHKDGNKENNHFSNLEWCTRAENEMHKRNVLGKDDKGERNGNFGYRPTKMYPSPTLRNKLCSLGIPRNRHNLAELGEMLKGHIADMRPCNAGWEVRRMIDLGGKEAEYASASTLADAMAKMLIHIIESGIVKV